METVFDLFLWGMAGSLALAPLGAGFGALAHRAAPARQSIGQGMASGALFLAVLGFLTGALIRGVEPSFERCLVLLATVCGSVLALMLLAGLFAGVAQFCVWLGVRGTGLVAMLAIALGFGAIVAWKAGFGRETIALSVAACAVAGLVTVVVLRLRSPYGANAFNPWADDVEVSEKSDADHC
jgi:hypothetical protein